MSDYIRVSTDNINRDRESIQSELNGIDRAVNDLQQEMQSLSQTWEGPAWQNFQGQVSSDIENMHAVCEKVSGFISHMEYASREYQKCENQVQNLVNSIRV